MYISVFELFMKLIIAKIFKWKQLSYYVGSFTFENIKFKDEMQSLKQFVHCILLVFAEQQMQDEANYWREWGVLWIMVACSGLWYFAIYE